jgi:hypothetical protein
VVKTPLVRIVVPLVTLLLCAACHQAEAPAGPRSIDLDGRRWNSLQQDVRLSTARDTTVEFAPAGQTVKDWQELLTVQMLTTKAAKHAITAADFEKQFSKQGEDKGQAPVTETLKAQPNESAFSWKSFAAGDTQAQFGVARVMQEPGRLRVVQYAAKQPLNSAQISKWQDLLNDGVLNTVAR